MYRLILFLVCTVLINTSCKELFTPDIENTKAPLVVDGLITDEAKPYSIKLSKAVSYDNNDDYAYSGVSNAKVTVSDNYGHTYNFAELNSSGVYMSDPTEFSGVPGRSYTLFIKTADSVEYRSGPQLLLPNEFNVKVESEFGTQEQLVDDGLGTLSKETVNGVNIFYTIENNEDTVIRFRFYHKLYKEYTDIPANYSCWGLVPNNDLIDITNNYGTSTNNIEKHNVCFAPTIKDEHLLEYVKDIGIVDNTRTVFKLITKIIQYRLNNETYQFYKNNYTLLAATGKIFDPIPSQVKGNIKCISDNTIEVLGFFEASSVRVRYYALNHGYKTLHYIKSYEPPCDFCCTKNGFPDWVP